MPFRRQQIRESRDAYGFPGFAPARAVGGLDFGPGGAVYVTARDAGATRIETYQFKPPGIIRRVPDQRTESRHQVLDTEWTETSTE